MPVDDGKCGWVKTCGLPWFTMVYQQISGCEHPQGPQTCLQTSCFFSVKLWYTRLQDLGHVGITDILDDLMVIWKPDTIHRAEMILQTGWIGHMDAK